MTTPTQLVPLAGALQLAITDLHLGRHGWRLVWQTRPTAARRVHNGWSAWVARDAHQDWTWWVGPGMATTRLPDDPRRRRDPWGRCATPAAALAAADTALIGITGRRP